ncbi:MAG: VPLPA-CTERM sorting domain-containing protein [Paracoccaceae bacterium]
MKKLIGAALIAASTIFSGSAQATAIPGVSDSYNGNFDIENAFGGHGLYLPNLISGLNDRTWSITDGAASFFNNTLKMVGSVSNGGFSLDFDFQVFENSTHAGGLVCGNNQACNNATQEMRDNIVFFDMGANSIMGTVTGTAGTALDGLSMDIVMSPLPSKPGQLGFGGNWTTLDFGYSNWMEWTVTSQASKQAVKSAGNGDINFDFAGNNDNNVPPVPLPAGMPLVLTAMAGLYAIRRRQNKA